MANEDLYIYDPDQENFVPNPEVTRREDYGYDANAELVGGEVVILPYDQLTGYINQTPGGNASGSLYPPGTFQIISQRRHIAQDGTIRVDVIVEVADDVPGKQYELRVTRT